MRILVVRKDPSTGKLMRSVHEPHTTTNILCWHCCHAFDTPSIPLPTRYDERGNCFHVAGTFCSWACVKAHNRDVPHSHNSRGVDSNTISLFRKRLTGSLAPITAAPPRYMLQCFGGPLTLQQFRNASSETTSYISLPPKTIMHTQVLEERKASEARQRALEKSKITSLDTTIDLSGVAPPVETLKLRRPTKKKANIQSMLQQTLGLAITSSPPPE